ncbi:MAG: UDP-N-acetylmuramate--L-alanine ligase [Oscillospiraceae bacterium]|nr:UDP-N-acetylmuramate--L-alanine ligase [Oscillospiraceae bacterium]MDD3832372.1 UDP-N-acetylmuramate--L-alanine ligase [Oscillospiraceae bacterium]
MDNINMDNTDILRRVKRMHFVGIGGSGMSPLAEILHSRGYIITGSDVNQSDNVERMRSLGIPVTLTQQEQNVGQAELVVYTAAINPENPELVWATDNGIPLIERGKLLGLITQEYARTIGVAGTHGKTTTTSMLAQLLLQGEFDPSVFIGGRLPLINANGRAGSSDIMVCEACEYQDHYLSMTPAVSVILNIDADHLDYFGTLANVINSFHRFAGLASNTVIVNADDANSLKAVEGIADRQIITFGLKEGCDWYAKDIKLINGSYGEYDLYYKGEKYSHIRLGVPGMHNVLNSLAAAAAAHWCGANAEQIAFGLQSFTGAGRRFEFLGTFGGVTVADDYAHHPTEISATLSAAKAMGYESVWAIFQPFTFSRTARHLEGFIESLSSADRVILSDIMGSREENKWGVSSEQITKRIPGALYLPTFEEIAVFVAQNASQGELVLTMGGGDIYKCARMIAKKLQQSDIKPR